ncbi:DUF3854 domain-containing protein [Leptolyngbya sp. FACHB-321]|uniref:plasmid replication protein, CyRepA1 family n=1 Tax=Leptolyngbya sp. FACHB-321 TaxID=2692807 RepID=UPI0016871DA2|nr:plasmid replication protein, CyRepA1 family [Leptolyngbya sp. FACHB-321]MBD2034016.1 DUF3854 domain-containing protein [Leptolyngbya sp. FACHB-321]
MNPVIASSQTFSQRIEQEFTVSSAIVPTLYHAATQLVEDTEFSYGEVVACPIHEALNWRVTRFGHQARQTIQALLLLNEDSSTWQAKLSAPRTDTKGKAQKYETPVGNGARAYLPPIPIVIRQQISDRYGVRFPSDGAFWEFVEQHPEIPIVITEGGKKALAGLSQGFVTIALYGCHGGYRTKDALGNPIPPTLISDLARFAAPNRRVTLAFDEDTNGKTRRRVNQAQGRLGQLLQMHGCEVFVASWDSQQGKGLDDLIVNAGASVWEVAYNNALPLSQWQIWEGLERRLTIPINLTVKVADLVKLDVAQLPDTGLLAIYSPKGTGKTKLLAALVKDNDRVLSLTHRISLGRNLCSRTGLTYRGDLDRLKGQYMTASGYTLRIGSCVDGLLSLDPERFVGCDLLLDEAVALVRHLLTSSTCARDGKRPALLARFRALVQGAKRVILADADLDNATVQYVQNLRGDRAPVFLVQNKFEPQPYPCVFLQTPDRTAIISDLLAESATLPAGKVLFICTDSRALSESLHCLITQQYPAIRSLLLNSKTTGGECEREFMQTPDAVLTRGDYDIVICSPSVAQGVSIECQGVIHKVYGIFVGASSIDAEMSQLLSRVREPVDRVVWCAKVGSNYAKVSRSGNPLEVRAHLQSQTTATVQIIRSSLKEDTAKSVDSYDWQTDPHVQLYSSLAAEQNRSMYCLREAFLLRLQWEGNIVTVEDRGSDKALKLLLAQTRQELRQLDAEAMVAADAITYAEVLVLEQKERCTTEERDAIAKFWLQDFYDLEALTVDAVLADKDGRTRREILGLEALLNPQTAIDRSAKALEKETAWNHGVTPWDFSHAPLRVSLQREIGLDVLFSKIQTGWLYGKDDLKPYADRARSLAPEIKVALHFSIKENMSDVQIIHQLFSQMGIRMKRSTTTKLPGCKDQKVHCYSLDLEVWAGTAAILSRRQAKRERLEALSTAKENSIHPHEEDHFNEGGGYSETPDAWLSADNLAGVRSMLELAGDDAVVIANIREAIPGYVLERVRARA